MGSSGLFGAGPGFIQAADARNAAVADGIVSGRVVTNTLYGIAGGIDAALLGNDLGPAARGLGGLAAGIGIGKAGSVVTGTAKVVGAGATVITEGRVAQVTLNKAAGDAFEADVIANVLPKTQVNIQSQITIKSGGPSALNVRLDALGIDMTGATRLSDMKASDTASFTMLRTH